MSKINFSEVFAAGYKALSRLIIEYSTEQKEFTKGLRYSLAHTARKLYPHKSVSELAHMTGLHRNQIDDALQEKHPVPVMDKESIILGELWRKRDQHNCIPMHSKTRPSFQSIASEHLNGRYSIGSVLESLLKSGAVEKHNEDLHILSNKFIFNQNEELVINEIAVTFNRLIDTIFHNVDSNNDLHYQYTYKSTKIPPSKRDAASEEIFKHLQKIAMQGVQEIIDKYEADVPNGQYPEFGVSMFNFDLKKGKKS
ncbi:MAG TPA: hypothetical protein ENJ41_08980 [Oceanospirillales bacterium]|nr:hypothetical protein [Oceanospirillales bacterium]